MVCRNCLARRSHEAYLEAQRDHLPAVLAGKLYLHTRRAPGGQGYSHIELFNDHEHAYCGQQVTGWKRDELHYSKFEDAKLCKTCREIFDSLLSKPANEDEGAVSDTIETGDPPKQERLV
jgi:hypothetical protein